MNGLLFPPGTIIPQCHASTVAALADGRLAAAWFAGSAEGAPDTAIRGALFADGQWSVPQRWFRVSEEAHWNPVLGIAPDGRLHIWFKVGRDCAQWRTWHALSPDGGETWSTAEPFLPDDVLARGPVRCPPIITTRGTWLAGGSEEQRPDADGRRWWPFIERSSDGGRRWTATPIRLISTAPAGTGGIQPTLWESSAGIHCLLRTGLGHLYRSDSADDGQSWCPAYPTALPNNNSGVAVAALGDGRLLLAWNPVSGDWGARTPLRLSLSDDNGQTWRTLRDLAEGFGEFSYPAIAVGSDCLTVTWTDRRQTIGWWQGALDRIS
jgi:predicted neuraminidase